MSSRFLFLILLISLSARSAVASNFNALDVYFVKNKTISTKQDQIKYKLCDGPSDCPGHCTCVSSNNGIQACVDVEKTLDLANCLCESDVTCPGGDQCQEIESVKFCFTCAQKVSIASVESCVSSNESEIVSIPDSSNESEVVSIPVPVESSSNDPCISTAWLEKNNLMEFTLHNGGVSSVLCIPGLPCGTKGHMLRFCDSTGVCNLISYKEACDSRTDCTESTMPVSQISHSFDWSTFQVENLQLTSLSVDPDSGKYSFSRLTAKTADFLIANKLGFVCNIVVRMYRTIQESLLRLAEVGMRFIERS